MNIDESLRFCDLLSKMIKDAGITQAKFYNRLKIKKPYFYDILSGKTNPPPPEKQFAIIEILEPDVNTRNLFFELAAKERNEVPADIARYLQDDNKRTAIREKIDYKKMLIDGGNNNGKDN